VHAELEKDREVAPAAVLRLLQIMHGKGLLTRDEAERSHVYAPAQAQDTLQTSLLGDLIRKAFAGSGKALVLAALKGGHVTAQERLEIEQFLQKEGGDQ
jgi:predicted transcriptional regulator